MCAEPLTPSDQVQELMQELSSAVLDQRLTAINILGEIGDEAALRALRECLRMVNPELVALVTAIGKLKMKLGSGSTTGTRAAAFRRGRAGGC